LLELVDVHTYYGETHILRGISLGVAQGSAVALLGRNGMGKTTTIRTIIGFTPLHKGIVRLKGEVISSLPSFRISRMGVALVPQGRRIFPSLTVKENLIMSARNLKKPGAWDLDRVYSLFPILKSRASLGANLLSGGEQQMLAIGRAQMTNPNFLLMDEPSEGLAFIVLREIQKIILQLKKSGISILLVEQNLPLALSVCDYAYVITKGKIVYESTADELRDNEEAKTEHLGVGSERS